MIWFLKKRNIFRSKSTNEIKILTRILIVDDQKPTLVKDLEKEGWKVRYLKDLDSFENKDLIDSHIICLDILGVGTKLHEEGGMALVPAIKEKYPSKKILLYSSVNSHDIFDPSLDMVDKRVFKDGRLYPFSNAIEELAFSLFDWDHCVNDIYQKFKKDIREDMTYEEFERILRKSINSKGILDVKKFTEYALCGLKVAELIASIIRMVYANQ